MYKYKNEKNVIYSNKPQPKLQAPPFDSPAAYG